MQRYNFFLILANLFSHHRHNHLGTAGELQERLLQTFTTVHSAQLWAQWEITWAMIILLPNRESNQKQKHKKQPWGKVDSPRKRAIHFAPRIKTARRFTAKNP